MGEDQEREPLKESELARKICLGHGERFKEKPCEHFDQALWECKLLRNYPIGALLRKRCLPNREFYGRAHIILSYYPEHLRGEDVDLQEFIHGRHDEKIDRKGILEGRSRVPAIHYMFALINLSLKREIERILKRKGLIPPVRQCGNCVHRSPAEPHMCDLETIPGKREVEPFYNQHFGTEREAADHPCDGYVAIAYHLNPLEDADLIEDGLLGSHGSLRLGARSWRDQLGQFEAVIDVPVVFKALRRCAANAPTHRQAETFERWYEDNAWIYNRLTEGANYEQAKSEFLNTRTDNEKQREAYSTKMRRDCRNLEKCLSGEERCERV